MLERGRSSEAVLEAIYIHATNSKRHGLNLTYKNRSSIFFSDKLKFNIFFKDTHREKAPPNETPTPSKSINMDIWVVGTSNQLFIRGS